MNADYERNNKEEWRQQEEYCPQQHAPDKSQRGYEEPQEAVVQTEPIIPGMMVPFSRKLNSGSMVTSEGDG